jgi:4-diphosphocytidyl-2-C-methyl-D-erythritol kinase
MKYHKFLSPAKVNLYLKIVGKTENNYHLLQSFFHTIDLSDIIYIRENEKATDDFELLLGKKLNQNLTDSEKDVYFSSINNTDNNIIIKTLILLREKFNIKNYKIILEKNIPVGAGLGGGSSNAAQIINYINIVEKLNLSDSEKISIAKKIGADVPFFLFGGLCFVEGIGEKITSLNFSLGYNLLLVYPKIITATEKVYKKLKMLLTNKTNDYKLNADLFNVKEKLISFLNNNDFKNDLEQSCFLLYPEIQKIKNSLVDICLGNVFLSGSGSTVCSLFIERKECDRVINNFIAANNKNVICYLTKTTKQINFKFEEAILDENN